MNRNGSRSLTYVRLFSLCLDLYCLDLYQVLHNTFVWNPIIIILWEIAQACRAPKFLPFCGRPRSSLNHHFLLQGIDSTLGVLCRDGDGTLSRRQGWREVMETPI